MATLYFNSTAGANDGDWSNPSNWWIDDTFLIPAGTTPNPSDDVEITESVFLDTSNLASSPGVGEATFRDCVFDPDINGLTLVSISNNIQFYGGSSNKGTLVTSGGFVCAFHDSSDQNGTVTGDATFNDYSINASTVSGNAIFNGFSQNNGDGAYNGVVSGNATFNDNGYNVDGIILQNATFNDNAGNDGEIYMNATFNGQSFQHGFVYGDAVLNDYSTNNREIDGNATFNDNSYNGGGYIWQNATFNDNSYNNGVTNYVGGVSTFNAPYTYNAGEVTGAAYFHGNYGNSGTCDSDAYFYDDTYNTGTIGGGAYFYDRTYNDGGTLNGSTQWGGIASSVRFNQAFAGSVGPQGIYFDMTFLSSKKAFPLWRLLKLPFPLNP
jgi:hypothetical protein